MFEGTTFLIVTSLDYKEDCDDVVQLASLLREKGGQVVFPGQNGELPDPKAAKFTHIIARSIDFPQYILARASMIPVTTPEWALKSLEEKRCLNPKPYTPDASCTLKDCFVCVADNLPAGDKHVIYDIVRAFGGSCLDVLTRYTTHLIALDLSCEKCIIAASVASSPSPNNIDIKIVLPRWLDDCLASGKMIDESPYTLPCMKEPDTLSIPPQSDLLQEKTVYISSDYNLSEKQWSMIRRLLRRSQGQIATSFDSSVNVYVGKLRQGASYVSASMNPAIVVGNLQWLLHVVATQEWISPIESNLLHYPVPNEPLESFKGLKISVTNYSGDARAYLAQLIMSLGGEFTKTLTRDNDFLVAAAAVGRKYETAKSKWLDENNRPSVEIVNHTWLEECYAKWLMLNPSLPQYQCLDHNTIPLAATKLDPQVLENWWLLQLQLCREKLEPTNIADSMSEDESTQSKSGPSVNAADHKVDVQKSPGPTLVKEPATSVCDVGDAIMNEHDVNAHLRSAETSKLSPDPENISFSPESTNTMTRRYGGRLAALRAALKLHENMSDLNEFNESKKSARKMQSYMEQVQGETPSKRKTPPPQNTPAKRAKSSSELQNGSATEPFDIAGIITGCENIIKPSKRDLARLASIGIRVASDFLPELAFNTVIAPKVLRTEKFLRSLSTVTSILHPSFLVDVLQGMETSTDVSADFSPDKYMLNKVVSVADINTELGLEGATDTLSQILCSSRKGKLFGNMSLNLSANLNGGPSTIARILADHGAKQCVPIKAGLSAIGLKKALVQTEQMPVPCVLVAHKTKDTKLIANFKTAYENGAVVDWDWCVKSIFKMAIEPLDAYGL